MLTDYEKDLIRMTSKKIYKQFEKELKKVPKEKVIDVMVATLFEAATHFSAEDKEEAKEIITQSVMD